MSNPLYLSVVEAGLSGFRRWRICDARQRVWTGTGWSEVEADGVLYESNQKASTDVQKLLLTEHMEKPVRRFVAPVIVELFCDGEFTAEELRAWLVRVARLHMDYKSSGMGPLDGSLGLLQIEWGRIEEQPH